ncbi:MAG: hypothetical protein LC731_00680 [Acidobacteria bacterium]|nr:hypothetical protein [Acidobacteriota bacterium]
MMKLNRREQITNRETHHRWFIRQSGRQQRFLCSLCDERIQMITLGEAATAARLEPQAMLILAETGKLHSMKTDGDDPLICLNSLINFKISSEKSRAE